MRVLGDAVDTFARWNLGGGGVMDFHVRVSGESHGSVDNATLMFTRVDLVRLCRPQNEERVVGRGLAYGKRTLTRIEDGKGLRDEFDQKVLCTCIKLSKHIFFSKVRTGRRKLCLQTHV